MNKKVIFLLLILPLMAFANAHDDALKARNQAMQALKSFNPAIALKEYTANPKESGINPSEGKDILKGLGVNALGNNPSAKEVYQSANTRSKAKTNPNSKELLYAETLLENPDEVLEGTCYKEKASCEPKISVKNCEEEAKYKSVSCQEQLEIHVKSMSQNFSRKIATSSYNRAVTFDLTHCPTRDRWCTVVNQAILTQPCESLQVAVTLAGRPLNVTKQPTCSDTTVTVKLPSFTPRLADFQITVTESLSEDVWTHEDCAQIQKQKSQGSCVIEEADHCLEPNVTKIINGIAFQRPCWKTRISYQCIDSMNSTCTPWINQGCSQVGSTCMASENSRCYRYVQTFQCMEQFCMPEKTICPQKMACTDGSCDESVTEISDDVQEGISRLGALAGVASDVAANQVRSGVASVFTGSNSLCRIAVAGIGNCCGGSHRLLHCNDEEKALGKAKDEGRAFKVGTYCAHKAGICIEKKQSWCVFPSKLSAIIQIQGRYKQLGINFGAAYKDENNANCRGITPEELERINFSLLDLSPILTELMARMALPDSNQIGANNQAKVMQWNQQEKAHD